MFANSVDAYQAVEKATLSGRDLEASALMRCAMQLATVKQDWNSPERDQMLDEALRMNQKLWTLFQAELTEPDNPLPAEIKQNILSLSVFVDKRTFEIMAFPEADKLDVLISINQNIAAGLRGSALASGE